MWMNFSWEILRKKLGNEKFNKLLEEKREASPSCMTNVLGRNALSLASHNALKMVPTKRQKLPAMLKRYHAVGAVGYAYVIPDNPIKNCEFFNEDHNYKIRFRVSNVNCKDDRDGCLREVVIKFVDQDHDGPFDLFFQTGRMSLARDCSTFLQMLNLKNEDDMEKWCLKNPYVYRALVDGIRRGPSSFADLTYYSQICYRVSMPNKKKQLVKFRLIPVHAAAKYDEVDFAEDKQVLESGMLTVEEQNAPWLVLAADDDKRNDNYLRQEFKTRLWRDEPVTFYMDVQMGPQSRDYDHVNPQLLWNEDEFPWSRLMRIELTTHVASEALRRTTFNMADNPAGIGFPTSRSPQDPFSLQKVIISTYTEIERKEVNQICDSVKEKTEGALNTTYLITIFSESLKESRPIPFVEVYVTLIGKRCRSSPLVLSRENREGNWEKVKHYRKEVFRTSYDTVDDLLGVVVEVYYRHITESWFLRSLTVEDVKQNKSWTFPCYEVVENPILLLPGEAYLAHNEQYQVSKKEKLFQLNERKCEYLWDKKDEKKLSSSSSASSGVLLPGQIRNPQQVNKLPERHKSRAAKYTGVRWEVDPKLIDFFREFRFRLAVDKSAKSKSLQGKMKKAKLIKKTKEAQNLRTPNKAPDKSKRPIFMKQFSDEYHGNTKHQKYITRKSHIVGYDEVDGQDDALANRKSIVKRVKSSFKKLRLNSITKQQKGYHIECLKNDCVDGSRYLNLHSTFDMESKLPDGSPGDMCHAVLKDEDFANLFLVGSNPVLIQKCSKLPNKFPVTNVMVRQFLDGYNLQQAIEDGRIFIVDYKMLNKITTVRHNTDHRFIASPIVLLYSNDVGTLLPLAIQLNQEPAADSNPIWTPIDKEGWLLAKLWVRCSDFNYQFAVSHLFNCHFLMEPFLIATMRCLPSSHPCYKILLPHFRYLLVSNTLIRHQLLSENGAVDKYTSLGRIGFQELMERHWTQFHFDHLNPRKDFERREVSDASHLPGYIYRDDALRLFDCINNCCDKLLNLHYGTLEDFQKDVELTSWFDELSNFGFPGHFFTNDSNLNKNFSNFPFNVSSSQPLVPSAPPLEVSGNRQFLFDEVDSTVNNITKQASNLHNQDLRQQHQNVYSTDLHKPSESESVYDEINSSLMDGNNKNFNDNKNLEKIFVKTINPTSLVETKNNSTIETGPSANNYANIPNSSGDSKLCRPSNLKELGELLSSIIFTITCQHSATHSDALDLFGYVPDVPAMMKALPITKEFKNIDSKYLGHILPEQFPEAYYTSLLFIMNAHKPDENLLGELDELYFSDEQSIKVLEDMRKEMRTLTIEHATRNFKSNIKYDCLLPKYITSSPEPLPYIARDRLDKILLNLGATLTLNAFLEQASLGTTAYSFALEQCLFFYEAFDGRSARGLFMGEKKGVATDKTGRDDELEDIKPKMKSKQVRQVVNSIIESDEDAVDGVFREEVIGIEQNSVSKREKFTKVGRVMSLDY